MSLSFSVSILFVFLLLDLQLGGFHLVFFLLLQNSRSQFRITIFCIIGKRPRYFGFILLLFLLLSSVLLQHRKTFINQMFGQTKYSVDIIDFFTSIIISFSTYFFVVFFSHFQRCKMIHEKKTDNFSLVATLVLRNIKN